MKLILRANGEHTLARSHNPVKGSVQEVSKALVNEVKSGTNIVIDSDNSRVKLHRGKYYVLVMKDYNIAYFIYVDVGQTFKLIGTTTLDKVVNTIYYSFGDGMTFKFLRDINQQSYRVMLKDTSTEGSRIIPKVYKNRDGQLCEQVYMTLYEGINEAVATFRKYRDSNCVLSVVTRQDMPLFELRGKRATD